MRLWHYKLIPVLPKQQLLGQWRECCLIAKQIKELGTPNHILVNQIMNYPAFEFDAYARMIFDEMSHRKYLPDYWKFVQWRIDESAFVKPYKYNHIFSQWHDDEYLRECYYNLEEKHNCGGIPDEEWSKIEELCQYVK